MARAFPRATWQTAGRESLLPELSQRQSETFGSSHRIRLQNERLIVGWREPYPYGKPPAGPMP
jgi:hypothetical protein